jgi:hypothetical protein
MWHPLPSDIFKEPYPTIRVGDRQSKIPNLAFKVTVVSPITRPGARKVPNTAQEHMPFLLTQFESLDQRKRHGSSITRFPQAAKAIGIYALRKFNLRAGPPFAHVLTISL